MKPASYRCVFFLQDKMGNRSDAITALTHALVQSMKVLYLFFFFVVMLRVTHKF
jgi:hypothetical protein